MKFIICSNNTAIGKLIRARTTSIAILLPLTWIGMQFGCNSVDEPKSKSNASSVLGSTSSSLPKVATIQPKIATITQKTEQPGRIEAYATTRVHAKVSGFLDRLLVDIGDKVQGPRKDSQGNLVEPGQLLAVLVAPELTDELQQKDAMIEQVEAELDQAKASIAVAESAALSAEAMVNEAIAGQRRVEADYARWKSESDRMNKLASTQTVTSKVAEESQQQMRAADAARDELAARILSAKAKANEAKAGIVKAKADLRSVEAKRRMTQSEYQRIQSLCEYLNVRAPYSGIVSERSFDAGSLVQVGQATDANPLFTIVQSDKVRVVLDVPEADAVLVSIGGKATIKLPALQNRVFEGTVARTSWALRANTRTLECEIEVPNLEGILRPGMYSNVDLVVAQIADTMSIPKSAVVQHEGKPSCLVVGSDGTLSRKSVQLGIASATEFQVIEGLAGNENLLSANLAAFKVGQKVEMTAK